MWRWWNYFASHNHFTFLRVSRTVELGFDVHDLNWLVSRFLNAHDLWIKIISVYLIFTGGLLVLWASYLSMVLKCLQETCKILDFSCELTENIYCKQNQLEKLEAARSAYLWLPLLWLPFLALLSLSRPYWAFLGLTGPYWALLGLTSPYFAFV